MDFTEREGLDKIKKSWGKVSKYPTIKDGEWVVPKRRGYVMVCCGCGLTHRFNFKLVKTPTGNQIYFQAFRDQKATGQRRRKIRRLKNDLSSLQK